MKILLRDSICITFYIKGISMRMRFRLKIFTSLVFLIFSLSWIGIGGTQGLAKDDDLEELKKHFFLPTKAMTLKEFQRKYDTSKKLYDLGDSLLKTVNDKSHNTEFRLEAAKDAKKCFNAALEKEPGQVYYKVLAGYADLLAAELVKENRKRQLLSSAVESFQEAVDLQPGYALAHHYLGETYALQEKWSEAESKFKLLLENGWENANVHAWLGYIYLSQGKGELARASLDKAVQLGYPPDAADWAEKH